MTIEIAVGVFLGFLVGFTVVLAVGTVADLLNIQSNASQVLHTFDNRLAAIEAQLDRIEESECEETQSK